MKIVFDLDGVLRNLSGYLENKFGVPYPQQWFWKHKDKDIFDWVKQDNYLPLIYSPATEYYWIVKYCFEKPEIWTCQPEEWKAKTKCWLDVHFEDYEVKFMTNQEKRQALDDNPDVWLVEDNPLFTSWERIILIDQPYNRHIQQTPRITCLEDLDRWIWQMLKRDEHTGD